MKKSLIFALVFTHACLLGPAYAETADTKVRPSFETVKTKEYTAQTKDGWQLSITRFFSLDETYKVKKGVVILCHGFNINNNFWDIDKRSSLARYLSVNGYDVWAPSLRGSGKSSKPLLSTVRDVLKLELTDIPRSMMRAPLDATKFDWTIDDHIRMDAPAIIALVKRKTGCDKVFWIGHSMGGIIMYAYLETALQSDIAGFIPVSSMMYIPHPLNDHLKMVAEQKPLLTASLIVNTTAASQFRNLTLGAVKHPIEDLLLERENMHEDVLFNFFRTAVDDTAPGVVSQFSDSIRKGEMLSADQTYSYTNNLNLITVPILLMAGGKDGFVQEDALRLAYEAVSSKDKNIIVFSKANGYLTDYGHCDLIMGKTSQEEVYPVILNWLDKRYNKY